MTTNNIVADFESFYSKDLSVADIGVANYVEQAEAYMVSIASDDGMRWCGHPSKMIAELGDSWIKDPNNRFWAANANFDRAYWEKLFPMPAHEWQCSLDAGRVNQISGNLSGITETLTGRKLDKSKRNDMKGRTFESLGAEEAEGLRLYCLDDSIAALNSIPKLPMSALEAKVAAMTRAGNRRGVQIDTDLLEKFIVVAEGARMANLKRIPWRAEMPPLSLYALPKYCLALGLVCPKSRDKRNLEMDLFLEANPPIAEVVKAVRQYDYANKMLEKLLTIKRRLRVDGTLPLEMIYCGAPHTRRWSCRGVNVQNLDRSPVYYDREWNEIDIHEPSTRDPLDHEYIWLRHLIIAPPGKQLAAIDYAAIEPRVLAWLVGDQPALDSCATGMSVYEAYARKNFGWTGGNLKKENPKLYQQMKPYFLGAGYGQGWATLQSVARVQAGVDLTDDEAKRVTVGYRKDNPRVVNMWAHFDDIIRGALLHKTDKAVEIDMPTGETLAHFEVRPHRTEKGRATIKSQTLKHQEGQNMIWSLWGGVLTENVTQRMARDLMAHALVDIEEAGAGIVNFSVHDEAVLLLDKGKAGKKQFAECERIMQTTPAWAEGLPLGTEGALLDRYTKM